MKSESTMGCNSDPRDTNMQERNSQENDGITDRASNTNSLIATEAHTDSVSQTNISEQITSSAVPSTPHGGLPHSSTDPNLRGIRPRSAHQHRQIGQILRVMGDGYCYSCGVALRQMGDQLSGEYEVRRALSTGDLPNFVKNSG